MKKTSRSDLLLIEDIKAEVDFIVGALPNLTKEKLIEDKLYQNALIRSVEVIGEAAKDLSDDFSENNKEIPVHDMCRSRDKMIHGYATINYDLLWEILSKDMPNLQLRLQNIKL